MLFEELQQRTQGKKVLILGIGNRLRGDDAVGSILTECLKKKLDVPLIDAGDVPENFLASIEASGVDLVMVLDAADLGASPGDLSLIEMSQLKKMGVSMHMANLSLLFRGIPKLKRPEAILVAIQPEQMEAGQELSGSVDIAMKGMQRLLVQLFS